MGYEDVGLRAKIENVAGFMRDADRIEREMKGLGQSAEKSARQADSSMRQLVSSAKAAAVGIGAAFAGLAIGRGLKDSIDAASDLAESTNKAIVVFGEGSDVILSFAEDAAYAIGQSKKEALDAAGAFGAMFRTSGIGARQAAAMSVTETLPHGSPPMPCKRSKGSSQRRAETSWPTS